MQCLPNIEILTFLNWMDTNCYARKRIGIPLDELFLNKKYHDQVLAFEREYMRGRSTDSLSEKAAYERYVDYVLAELKRNVMQEYDRHPYYFDSFFIDPILVATAMSGFFGIYTTRSWIWNTQITPWGTWILVQYIIIKKARL